MSKAKDEAEFCESSRRWLDFLYSWKCPTCPYKDMQRCGYVELRETTPYYRRKLKSMREGATQ